MPTTANWTRMLPFGVANPFSNVTPNNGNFSIANAVYNFWNLSGIKSTWLIGNNIGSLESEGINEYVYVLAPKFESGTKKTPDYTPKEYNHGFGSIPSPFTDNTFEIYAILDPLETPFPFNNDYAITARLTFKSADENGLGNWEIDDILLNILLGHLGSVQFVTYSSVPVFVDDGFGNYDQYGHTIKLSWKGQGIDYDEINMYATNGQALYPLTNQIFDGTIDLTNEYFQYL